MTGNSQFQGVSRMRVFAWFLAKFDTKKNDELGKKIGKLDRKLTFLLDK